MNSTVIATYCSANKKESKIPLPAIDMYSSKRIKSIHEISKNKNLPFYILSGKYGFIKSSTIISYYDHLLIAEEIPKHIALVTSQLRKIDVEKIIFYHSSLDKDTQIKPYLETLQESCKINNIHLEMRISQYFD